MCRLKTTRLIRVKKKQKYVRKRKEKSAETARAQFSKHCKTKQAGRHHDILIGFSSISPSLLSLTNTSKSSSLSSATDVFSREANKQSHSSVEKHFINKQTSKTKQIPILSHVTQQVLSKSKHNYYHNTQHTPTHSHTLMFTLKMIFPL